jgi:glutaconate CoA-transferase subunit B
MAAVNRSWTVAELMSACLARELADEETAFIGVGTGRGFTLAVGIPLVAARLAQLTHAPHFVVELGPMVSPDLREMPRRWTEDVVLTWPAVARIPEEDSLDRLVAGRIDVAFMAGAQVDVFGNLNSTIIGTYEAPKRRLIGVLAQAELLAFVRKPLILMVQSHRSLVERVDFITGVGFYEGGESRTALGLPPGGPRRLITDLAVFDFETPDHRMRLVSLHPGVDLKDVTANASGRFVVPPLVPETPAPTADEIRLVREVIDPDGALTGGELR